MHSMDIMTDEMGGGGSNALHLKNILRWMESDEIYWKIKAHSPTFLKHIHIVTKSGNAYAWNDTCSTVNSNDALWLQNEHLQFAVLSNHTFWRPRPPEMWPTVLQIHISVPWHSQFITHSVRIFLFRATSYVQPKMAEALTRRLKKQDLWWDLWKNPGVFKLMLIWLDLLFTTTELSAEFVARIY